MASISGTKTVVTAAAAARASALGSSKLERSRHISSQTPAHFITDHPSSTTRRSCSARPHVFLLGMLFKARAFKSPSIDSPERVPTVAVSLPSKPSKKVHGPSNVKSGVPKFALRIRPQTRFCCTKTRGIKKWSIFKRDPEHQNFKKTQFLRDT
jgi:hypothetical protein